MGKGFSFHGVLGLSLGAVALIRVNHQLLLQFICVWYDPA